MQTRTHTLTLTLSHSMPFFLSHNTQDSEESKSEMGDLDRAPPRDEKKEEASHAHAQSEGRRAESSSGPSSVSHLVKALDLASHQRE